MPADDVSGRSAIVAARLLVPNCAAVLVGDRTEEGAAAIVGLVHRPQLRVVDGCAAQ